MDLKKKKKIIGRQTKIVSLTHISNVLGTVNPIRKMAELAHKAGAICIVDAAQSVPHMPVDVKELGCDFLAFSGHKMGGPMGIGVLWGKRNLLEKMQPIFYGGEMVQEVSFTQANWNEVPWKFEAGTPNVAGAIGLAAAVNFLQARGMKAIEDHGRKLTVYALQKLSLIPGLEILGPKNAAERGALISFVLSNVPSHDLAEICNNYHIALRAGNHCAMPLHQKLGHAAGSVRISFYFYNQKEEIDTLVKALQEARRIFHE